MAQQRQPGLLLLVIVMAAIASALPCVQASSKAEHSHARKLLSGSEYDEYDPSYYHKHDHHEYDRGYNSYVGSREVFSLELIQDSDKELPAPGANTTDTALNFALVCRPRKSPYPRAAAASISSSSYGHDNDDDDEDIGPLIKSTPVSLTEIGKGQAHLRKFEHPKPVDIGKQRGLEVGTLRGTFRTHFGYDSDAPCHPLLAHTTAVEFNNVPVYAMITKTKVPVDASILRPLLPVARPATPAITPSTIPGFLPGLPDDLRQGSHTRSGKVVARRSSAIDAAFDTSNEKHSAASTPANSARVAVASEAYSGYDDSNALLCGLTLVARGPVKLRSGSPGPDRKHFKGIIEATLLWTDGVMTLPSFVADALNNGTDSQSLFSTTINQILTSQSVAGFADAKFQPLVGNSASSTAVNEATSAATGGNVNVTQVNNTATAIAGNATIESRDTNSNNEISVVNDMAGALELYLKLLKTVCHQHKEIPVSKPANLRLDVAHYDHSGPSEEDEPEDNSGSDDDGDILGDDRRGPNRRGL